MSEKSSQAFNPGQRALKWWQELSGIAEADEHRKQNGNPGALARLRRASSPIAALTEAQAIRLAQCLGARLDNKPRLERVGALAHVLAHVKVDDHAKHMAQMLGPDSKGDNAAMSSLRFQRLMAARDPADLMREMRGAVKLLKGTANIRNIGHAFYCWNDNTRITWTYHYWGAGRRGRPSQSRQSGQHCRIFRSTRHYHHRNLRRPHHEPFCPTSPADDLPAIKPQPRRSGPP